MGPSAYRASELSCEGVSPRALADTVGAPAYASSGAAHLDRYNARARAAEALVQGDRFTIVRHRETYEDLVEGGTTV